MTAKLKPNPFSTVTVRYCGREPVELRVWSVTRSRRATTRNIAKGTRADFDRLCKIAVQARSPNHAAAALSIEDYLVLTALGLWAPEFDLIDPIFLETPIRSGTAADAEPWPAGGFSLRGQVWLQHGEEASDALQGVPLDCLSPARPIVLLRRRRDETAGAAVAPSVAPESALLGVMLPYTPLHHLLARDVGRPLVMTSGNLSDEPIAYKDVVPRTRKVAGMMTTW